MHPTEREAAVADYTAKRIEEMEAVYDGAFVRARAALGVRSFGMAVEDLPPGWDGYPEHDHESDGQEEVYVVLRGGGEIVIDGERVALDPETIVRVGPGAKRKLVPGSDGMRVLALGGAPGEAYEAPEWSKAGAAAP